MNYESKLIECQQIEHIHTWKEIDELQEECRATKSLEESSRDELEKAELRIALISEGVQTILRMIERSGMKDGVQLTMKDGEDNSASSEVEELLQKCENAIRRLPNSK